MSVKDDLELVLAMMVYCPVCAGLLEEKLVQVGPPFSPDIKVPVKDCPQRHLTMEAGIDNEVGTVLTIEINPDYWNATVKTRGKT